ncbi:antitoxin ChpS [Pararobbsia alpina]|uniref:PbsX family transcriptional regulator n=1 Tax=Pararobbsia alpina TaxID=621374 RepID=UPI0039A48088
MELTIEKWGRSAILRLSDVMLAGLNVEPGDTLVGDLERGRLTLRRGRPQYTLESLVSLCDAHAPLSDFDREWESMKPVGRE